MFILNTNFSKNNPMVARLKANSLNQKNKNLKDPDLLLKGSISTNQLAPGEGDINSDGKVDFKDDDILGRYLFPDSNDPPEKLTEDQLKKADVNNDGKINYDDLAILHTVSTDLVINSYKPGSSVKGDLNGDGKVNNDDMHMAVLTEYVMLGGYLGTAPSDKLVKAIDFNGDGILNSADLTILESLYTEKPPTPPTPNNNNPQQSDKKAGDLNEDGEIDYKDLTMLGDTINNKKFFDKLTEAQKQTADINKDGKINVFDIVELQKQIGESSFYSFNPTSGIVGDFNGDSTLDNKDLNIFTELRTLYDYRTKDPANNEYYKYIKGFLDFNNDGEVTKSDKDLFTSKILHKPLPTIKPYGEINNDPKNWMVSQNLGFTNPNVDKMAFNANCMPTSLVMIARMFGKLGGGPEEAQKQINYIRELAGVSNEYVSVSMVELSDAAEALGLKSTHTFGDISTIKASLNSGKKIILGADPSKYGPAGSGGHAIVVSGFKDGVFEVYDPGFQRPIKISEKALAEAMQIGYGDMLVIGKINQTKVTPIKNKVNPTKRFNLAISGNLSTSKY